jgi:hypothetical protein
MTYIVSNKTRRILCPTRMNCQNHTCLVSLVAYASKEDNVADQPVYIQELSSTLEKTYDILLDSVKPRNAYCRLCQIAHKINK